MCQSALREREVDGFGIFWILDSIPTPHSVAKRRKSGHKSDFRIVDSIYFRIVCHGREGRELPVETANTPSRDGSWESGARDFHGRDSVRTTSVLLDGRMSSRLRIHSRDGS
ncbi:PREDICTED: uncharacterized protein LOC106750892 isoform X2 [Dinoponera quadriceps]|uniref:Uncharacterized protein LOC106750892 isoform X2 n=1 Tax=Dinoponera quadriceps TaxID=609295 RepID=A0A6P3YAE7_DINQU|nr:PREDICTED: uncharacterized protein LOC106750892 isoform X2 [Dinoponera quadriceps]